MLEFPGSVDGPWKRYVHDANAKGIGTVRYPRLVAKDADSAAKLKKRTLTNLYNERPAWLANAHKRLDEAGLRGLRLDGGPVGRRAAGEIAGAESGAGGKRVSEFGPYCANYPASVAVRFFDDPRFGPAR